MRLLKDEDVDIRYYAAEALGRLGPAGISELLEAMRDQRPSVRDDAARGLVALKPEDKAAVAPKLTQWLQDKNWEVRRFVAETLGNMGPPAKAAVPTLAELLRDNDLSVREAAAGALWAMGPEAKAAAPALKEQLHDEDWPLSFLAAEALKKIEGEN